MKVLFCLFAPVRVIVRGFMLSSEKDKQSVFIVAALTLLVFAHMI